MKTEFEHLMDDIDKSQFFVRDSIYSIEPIWYYADFEIKAKNRKFSSFAYLLMKIELTGNITWLVTNRPNGISFKNNHGLKSVSKEYAIDVLSEDESVLSKFAELTPVIFK